MPKTIRVPGPKSLKTTDINKLHYDQE